MHKLLHTLLILLLALPPAVAQQPVTPITSSDYQSLIETDSLPTITKANKDTTKPLRLKKAFTNYNNIFYRGIRTVSIHNGGIDLIPADNRFLRISGDYTIAAAVRTTNKKPALQNEYVQGESRNGQLTWLGPETNELFSYGPAIHTAAYDGPVYNNNLFRKGYLLSHSLSAKANILANSYTPLWSFFLATNHIHENKTIPDNTNNEDRLSLSVEKFIKKISIKGAYNYFSSDFSNDNGNGFLNRVYENALLTPISYGNAQNPQKAYSNQADNPLFLLNHNGHYDRLTQQTGSLALEKAKGTFNFGLSSSLDAIDQNSNQSLKPGTAFYPTGLPYTRQQNEKHYTAAAYSTYKIQHPIDHLQSSATINYHYNNDDIKIAYPDAAAFYHYTRASNEGTLSFNATYERDYFNTGLNIGDKVYHSTTTQKSSWFLPELGAFAAGHNLRGLWIKLAATYSAFYSEPNLNHSYTPYLLTQLSPQQFFSFMPTTELQSFMLASPIQHQEFTAKAEIDVQEWFCIFADLSLRNNKNNPFPTYENHQLLLNTLADIRYKGLELTLIPKTIFAINGDLSISNNISFYTYSNTVTHIDNGQDSLAIAGFSTVHNTLIKGQPLGVITGNTWLRDANHKKLIGPDGFPLASDKPSVIANPTPAYTLKFSHMITWSRLALDIEWEYRKGGDVWNGAQAVLDYYGRSAITGAERSLANYNPQLPVQQNKWVRYGYTGVAESYIQKADNIRLHLLSLAYTINIKKYLQRIRLTAYAENLILWSAYKGADPSQHLFDQSDASGLDFFNLPSSKSFGLNASIQF